MLAQTPETAIRLEGLTKRFGRGKRGVMAAIDLNLTIPTGQVFGFLGPNGAGKTTTIRMLLDLIRPTQGAAFIFGQDVRRSHAILLRVGALVEGAAFYPFLTGRRNLEVLSRTADRYDLARIDALLEQVGLAARARQRVKGYSSGMKQRLGLAAALLSDPDVLILDEPTNGLDPAGMQEVRLFIREQADRHGKTVFLSSHLLGEVEQICDRVAIIHHGRIVREGAVRQLLTDKARIRIEAEPVDQAAALLAERWPLSPDGGALIVEAPRTDAPHITRRLVEAGISVFHIATERQTLEEYFLEATRAEDCHD